ncbi:MAG: ABC transporter permease [Anaerolineales bacterium]|nr:ABC transporter permease [Anaerolineales bacterium]
MNTFRHNFWIVFRKELRELFRDRRALFWLFAPPIILPGIALCAGLFIGTQAVRIAQDGVPLYIENAAAAPDLVAYFEDSDGVYLVEAPSNPAEDPFGEAAIIVSIPDDFQIQLNQGATANLKLITKDNAVVTFIAEAAVRSVIQDYSDAILDQRLEAKGITEAWLTPISIGTAKRSVGGSVITSSGDEEGDSGGGNGIAATIFLPLAVTSWLLGGGMGLILDSTVGEKERQTIENILVTPVNRISVVLGKMTVVFIASMMVMSLWLSEGVLLNGLSAASPELTSEASTTEMFSSVLEGGVDILGLIAVLMVMIVPFTIMLNALVMAWCAYAANYREANLFMALVQLGLPATILLTIFSLPPDVADVLYGLPLFGTVIGIRDLFSGNLPMVGLVVNFVTSLLYSAGAIWFAAWVFGREWSLTRGLQ